MEATSKTWQKNLYAIAIAEFVVLIGFNFVNPFMPLFVQHLGDFTDRGAAFWAGLATGSSGLASFIAAPVWGMVADRWGRKPMVLRAQFAGAVAVALIGLSPNVYYLVGLRLLQGVLSGTVGAASALIASQTPRDRMAFAMGVLMVAIYAGTTVGPLLGGAVADSLGFRPAFFITGGLIFAGGIIVLFFVQEAFDRTGRGQRPSVRSIWRLATSREILPLLAVLCALQAGTQVLAPVVPLFIKELGSDGEAATTSGLTFSFIGALAAISALVAGRVARRVSLSKILLFSCIGTAILFLPPILAANVTQLVIFTVLTALFVGGMMTSASALVGLSVSDHQQGIAYGVAQSAQALGSGLGPMAGGGLASLLGFRSIFPITAALYLVVSILVAKLLLNRPVERCPQSTAGPMRGSKGA